MKIDYLIDRVTPNGAYISVSMTYNCPVHQGGHACSLSIPFSTRETIIAEAERMVNGAILCCIDIEIKEKKRQLEHDQDSQKTKERLQEVGLDRLVHHGVIEIKD